MTAKPATGKPSSKHQPAQQHTQSMPKQADATPAIALLAGADDTQPAAGPAVSAHKPQPAASTPQPDPNRWRALGVLAASVSLIVIDGTIVNAALPSMMTGLPLSFTQAQWVTTVYNLVFAALLITTGRLGDRVGRRTTLGAGLAVFAVGSLLAGLAPNAAALIAARATQGIGGALVLPSTLSTVNATFQGRERAAAFGIWGGDHRRGCRRRPAGWRLADQFLLLALDLWHQPAADRPDRTGRLAVGAADARGCQPRHPRGL